MFKKKLDQGGNPPVCEKCNKESEELPINLYRKIGKVIGEFNTKCNQLFISKDGGLGEAGREIRDAVQNHGSQCLYNDIDVSSVCPNYRSFNLKEKDAFWVYAFASIAHKESSCLPSNQNPNGTNDVADGLFQMEFSYTARRSAGRDPDLCKTSGPHPSGDIKFQAQCSISVLRDTNCRLGWPLDGPHGYWHLLRSNAKSKNGTIVDLIKKFPGCYKN